MNHCLYNIYLIFLSNTNQIVAFFSFLKLPTNYHKIFKLVFSYGKNIFLFKVQNIKVATFYLNFPKAKSHAYLAKMFQRILFEI